MKKILLSIFAILTFTTSAFALGEATVTRIAYDGNDNPQYVGVAPQNASTASATWKIFRITYSGSNATVIEWADGDRKSDNIWNNRASLSYR